MVPNLIAGFTPALSDEDRRWIADNLMRGGERGSLAAALIAGGRSPDAVRTEMDGALAHPFVQGALRARAVLERRLAKANWTLDVAARLDREFVDDPTPPVVDRISSHEFFHEFYARNRPCVITGRLDEWRALTRWSADYFISGWGERTVEVQTRRAADPDFEVRAESHTAPMRFGDFVASIRSIRSNEMYMTARNTGMNRKAVAELWDDIGDLSDYLAPTQPSAGFFWLGPAGTFTPLHHDLTNNFMAQVLGRKRVLMAAPHAQPRIYNHLHVFSKVDLAQIDLERFPDMREVRVIEWILAPGQILFLPVGWWHQVEALDLSATMTFTNFQRDNDFHSFYRANGEL